MFTNKKRLEALVIKIARGNAGNGGEEQESKRLAFVKVTSETETGYLKVIKL